MSEQCRVKLTAGRVKSQGGVDGIANVITSLFFKPTDCRDKDIIDLLDFHKKLNEFHVSITFELTYSSSKVNFLDTTVYIENNTIKTTLYTKPTDKKQYLAYSSSHPKHIMRAIPYSQALRYHRIITDDSILTTEVDKLLVKFTRDYPIEETKKQISKVQQLDRSQTLQYKTEKQKLLEFKAFTKGGAFLPLILTYRPEYVYTKYNLHKTLMNLWNNYIHNDEVFKATFGNSVPKIVYKKGQNLSNILMRAKYDNTETNDNSTANLVKCLAELAAESNNEFNTLKCGKKRCKLCSIITIGSCFSSSSTKLTYSISENMSCGSLNTIYLVTCTKCNIQYIGETGRTLRERFNNHRSDIYLNKNTAIAKHFNEILHEYKHLSVFPLETILDTTARRDKESYWIKILQTRHPSGLNFYPL